METLETFEKDTPTNEEGTQWSEWYENDTESEKEVDNHGRDERQKERTKELEAMRKMKLMLILYIGVLSQMPVYFSENHMRVPSEVRRLRRRCQWELNKVVAGIKVSKQENGCLEKQEAKGQCEPHDNEYKRVNEPG